PSRSPLFTTGTTPTGQGCALMRSLSLDQLASGSARIVVGRALSYQSFMPSSGQPVYTDVAFLVERELKGASGAKELRIRLSGGRIGDLLVNAGGTASFDMGRQTLVFLSELSPDIYRLVGSKQGKFAIGDEGRVERVDLTLSDFNDRILDAVQGGLSPAMDPLLGQGVIYLAGPALDLKPWGSGDIPIEFYVNGTTRRPSHIKPNDFSKAVKHGFDAWQDIEVSHIAFSYAGQTLRAGNPRAPDGYNDIRWGIGALNSSPAPYAVILGRTVWWARDSHIFEADIEIEPSPTGIFWTIGGIDQNLNVTLVHEVGHFLGIADHTDTPGSVMTEFYEDQTGLIASDKEIVVSMYPPGPGPRPQAPSGLGARRETANSTLLTWQDNAPDEYGYVIERGRSSAGPFIRIATVKRNVTSYKDTGLERNAAYYYRVRSFNQNGESDFSSYASNSLTFEARPDRTIGEGTELGGQLASFKAAGGIRALSATIDWGDGTTERGEVLDTDGGGSVTGSHVFADNGIFEVVVTVKDNLGGLARGGFTVRVENAAPRVEAGPDIEADEGRPVALTGVSFSDFGPRDTHIASIDWGDGSVEPATLSETNGSGRVAGSHIYADNGTFTVSITVTDNDGAFHTSSLTLAVNNLPPSLETPGDGAIGEGGTFQVTAGFADPGPRDTHTASIDWGDGSVEPATLSEEEGSGQVAASHIYADNGIFTVGITVTDNDGASHTGSFTLAVNNLSPSLE
ncbi:MAG: PKD domain-containing protein, partial [Dehalococcoidia bacterium]